MNQTNTDGIDAWRARWHDVGQSEKGRPWILGALFNEGRAFIDGAKCSDDKSALKAIERLLPKIEAGIEFRQLREFAFVERSFRPEDRNHSLSWRHHREIWAAGIVGARQQRNWLSVAEKRNLSTRDLRVALAESKGGGERKEKRPDYDLTFSLVKWSDEGTAGLRKMFPNGRTPNPQFLTQARNEVSILVAEMQRIGLL